MCRGRTAAGLLLMVLLGLLYITGSYAALYDKKRGLKAQGLTDEEAHKFIHEHSHHAVVNRHKNKEAIKDHPVVQDFLDWKQKYQENHPDAGAAWTGKIPHDFIHQMTKPHKSADGDMSMDMGHGHAHMDL